MSYWSSAETVIDLLLIVLLFIFYVATFILLFKRKDLQPLKNRASLLIFLSTLGNAIYTLLLVASKMIIHYLDDTYGHNNEITISDDD